MRKTSIYLEERQTRRLARLALEEGRSQSEIVREAITTYTPRGFGDRAFALGAGFERIDGDPRSISEIPDEELFRGFGE